MKLRSPFVGEILKVVQMLPQGMLLLLEDYIAGVEVDVCAAVVCSFFANLFVIRNCFQVRHSSVDTIERVLSMWLDLIAPCVVPGKMILITVHGNSLQTICMCLQPSLDHECSFIKCAVAPGVTAKRKALCVGCLGQCGKNMFVRFRCSCRGV